MVLRDIQRPQLSICIQREIEAERLNERMEVKLYVDSLKFETSEVSSGSDVAPPPRRGESTASPRTKRKDMRKSRCCSSRKIFPGPGVIEEELDSIDSVLTNPSLLPLTIVPTYASNLSKLSRQGSTRYNMYAFRAG